MKKIAIGIFVLLSLVAVTTSSYASELTKETVKQVISRVDNAVNDLNAKAVGEEMSSDVSITMNISIQGQTQIMKPSKQEYIAMLEQGWALYTNYKYNRSNMVIKIKSDKAYITADVQESMTIQGQNISGTSKEETIIELVNGKPLVTAVTAHTSM